MSELKLLTTTGDTMTLKIDIPQDDRRSLIEDLLDIRVGNSIDLGSCRLARTSDLEFKLIYDSKLLESAIDSISGGVDEYYFSDSASLD